MAGLCGAAARGARTSLRQRPLPAWLGARAPEEGVSMELELRVVVLLRVWEEKELRRSRGGRVAAATLRWSSTAAGFNGRGHAKPVRHVAAAGGMDAACKKTTGVQARVGIRWRSAWAAASIRMGHGRCVEVNLLTCGPRRGGRVRLTCGPYRN
jgi:hypothetical protein